MHAFFNSITVTVFLLFFSKLFLSINAYMYFLHFLKPIQIVKYTGNFLSFIFSLSLFNWISFHLFWKDKPLNCYKALNSTGDFVGSFCFSCSQVESMFQDLHSSFISLGIWLLCCYKLFFVVRIFMYSLLKDFFKEETLKGAISFEPHIGHQNEFNWFCSFGKQDTQPPKKITELYYDL